MKKPHQPKSPYPEKTIVLKWSRNRPSETKTKNKKQLNKFAATGLTL